MKDALDSTPTPLAQDLSKRSQLTARTIRLARMAHTAWVRVQPSKIGLFVASLFLFIQAITLMKEGARDLAFLVRDGFAVSNPANSLGFGWLFSYVVMSGSPVAAASLTFFDAGAIGELDAFAMITGSRLGAGFVVLFIGFIYVLRGRNRATNLSMGLLSLTVTGTTYVIGFIIGMGLLRAGLLDPLQFRSGTLFNSITDRIFTPVIRALDMFLPGWVLFLFGLGVILVSFNLFDRCLPQMTLKESQVGHMSRLVYRPWVMFALGGAITLISMSVSISLGILVPLGNRGFVRRENVIPYIMGANITTFVDTLLVAVLLNNPSAFTIVLVEMLSITIVSIVVLATIYRRYERRALAFVDWVTASNRNLALFMIAIFAMPITLMLL